MATATDDSYSADSGGTIYGGLFPGSPLTLNVEIATPEQIGVYLPTARSVASGSRVNARYKATASGTWLTAHPLVHIDPNAIETDGVYAVVDAFAGTIFDLAPGTSYDLELTLVEPGQSDVVYTTTTSTRALPAAAGSPNVTATTSDSLATKFAALVAGDVLELAAGTYTVSGLQLAVSGTSSALIYIRGASRTGTIIKDTTGTVLQFLAANYIVLENLTIEGSSSDSGTSATSVGIQFWDGAAQSYVTVRDVDFVGVDQGVISPHEVTGMLVYNCRLTGNNLWNTTFVDSNLTWNDDAIRLTGYANCAWNNTLAGFGDAFSHFGSYTSVGVYYYRNKVEFTGDDAYEADYSVRNCGFYDNFITNCATLLSVDPVFGGPNYCFRNVAINTIRGPYKLNSLSSGFLIYNNTVVRTDGNTSYGWVVFYNGNLQEFAYRNNILIYRGASATTLLLESLPFDPVDFDHNAWYPDQTFNWSNTGGSFASLALARAGLPATAPLFGTATQRHQGDVISASDPFVLPVTLGSNHLTQITMTLPPSIESGEAPKNSGVAVPGITDGYSGAAPDMGAIIGGRALPLWGSSTVPSWVRNQTIGTWIEVPANNELADLNPKNNAAINPVYPSSPAWNGSGFDKIIAAWCGGSFDQAGSNFYIWGGGHADYGGNEPYKLNLASESPAWAMLRYPTGAIGNTVTVTGNDSSSGFFPDGRPRPTHDYGKTVFVPGVGMVVTNLYYVWENVNGPGKAVAFDEATSDWVPFVDYSGAGDVNAPSGGACYDSSRACIWTIGSGTYKIIKLVSGAMTQHGTLANHAQAPALRYMTQHDLVVSVSSSASGGWLDNASRLSVFDPVTDLWAICSYSGSFAPGFAMTSATNGVTWDDTGNRLLLWDEATDRAKISTLTPGTDPRTDAWTAGYLTPDGSNAVTPTAPTTNGTFTRFGYAEGLGGCYLLNAVDQPVYFYKVRTV